VTEEKYPRLIVTRDKNLKGKYYGPFVSAEFRDAMLKALRQSFLIRTCRKLPKKACLRFHLQLCSAPCISNISVEDYLSSVKNAEWYMKGNSDELISKLSIQMKDFSSKQMYEKAKLLRNQIASLQVLNEKQTVEKEKSYDEDIINYIISDGKVYLILFNIVKGTLASKREFSFDYEDSFLDEFIVQYYSENKVPKQIIAPSVLNDESIKKYLENIRKGSVTIIVPEKGDKKQLLDLVQRNIEVSFFEMTNALRNELNLNSNPNVIECFDISNISGTSSVGSMVQFRGAKPDKSNYRRFKIKTVVGSDDFASIAEIVKRRYFRLKEENAQMPDLIVIDGGLGQLNAALSSLNELELKIPIISLAKKFEEIYIPGRTFPIRLKKDSKGLKLLIQIRDEAHRFAINYHRLLRSKKMKE
jgi:excinuclease ABC subunit C